jgi:hypothetical protein
MVTPAASFSAALAVEDFPWVRLIPSSFLLEPSRAQCVLSWISLLVVAAQVDREEEMGMTPDKFREVFDLAQRGARAFRERRYDEVIFCLRSSPPCPLCSSCGCKYPDRTRRSRIV